MAGLNSAGPLGAGASPRGDRAMAQATSVAEQALRANKHLRYIELVGLPGTSRTQQYGDAGTQDQERFLKIVQYNFSASQFVIHTIRRPPAAVIACPTRLSPQ